MGLGSLYQVTLGYDWYADAALSGSPVACRNVWYYRQSAGPTVIAAPVLKTLFENTIVIPRLRDIAPQNIDFQFLEIKDPYQNPDYVNAGLAYTGNRVITQGVAPSFLGVSYSTQRPYPGTRSGRKRFPFLMEEDMNGNNLAGTFLALADVTGLAVDMATVLSSGGDTFIPIVAKRADTPGALPTLSYDITAAWDIQSKIATQNTRKS